jgi:hypothetical protein
VIATLA